LLIGANWLVYVWAISAGEVYATSIGYYLNPLLNVLLGTLLLGTLLLSERLSRRQWIAVAIAALAVALLAAGAIISLWISLALALTFPLYGLVRKEVSVGSLPGLTIENVILLPLMGVIVGWYARGPQGPSFGKDWWLSGLIIALGVVTAVPLLLFAIAARRMDYSALGFIQYLAPTIAFFLGLTVFVQPLAPARLASFMLIWIALGVFVWDLWARRGAASA
jgi:chloramphenicol-sensitive protein RarD